MSIWKIFAIFGIVSAWSEKALADGKVTADEAAELVTKLGAALGLPTEIEIFDPSPGHEEKEEKAEPSSFNKINLEGESSKKPL